MGRTYAVWALFCALLAVINVAIAQNSLSGVVEGTWKSIPFALNLVESIASHDDLLYLPAVAKVLGFSANDDDDDDDDFSYQSDDDQNTFLLDAALYDKVILQLNLHMNTKGLIDFNLVNKIFTPRVQAHYEHYSRNVEPIFGPRLAKECITDSFGKEVSPQDSAWLLYNDKIYCSADEIFALQTDKKVQDDILLFDRVVGTNEDAPLLILYGNVYSETFKLMFTNLYASASLGKLRFVWRYLPVSLDGPKEQLTGYAATVRLTDTEWVNKSKELNKLTVAKDFENVAKSADIHSVPIGVVSSLGLMLSSFILSADLKTRYQKLMDGINDFPKYAAYLSALTPPSNFDAVKEAAEGNEKMGVSTDSHGIFVNGASINKLELDLFSLIGKVKDELNTVREIVDLGFSVSQAKKLITKFALITAVKEAQFRKGNSIMGNNENRFRVYSYSFDPKAPTIRGGVVFINDLEKDESYEFYPTDRYEAYAGQSMKELKAGQIPGLKENVHDIIFVLNFADKAQLKTFFTISKLLLDRGISQQLGVMPLTSGDPKDEKIAQLFYFLVENASPKEGLALLYKYYEAANTAAEEEVFTSLNIPTSHDHSYAEYRSTLQKFSLDEPSVIFNGVIYDLKSPSWQIDMGKQLQQDVKMLQQHIVSGADKGKSLKDLLYKDSRSSRNLRVVPKDPSNVIYKRVSQELIDKSYSIKKKTNENDISGTFWLIGDFSTSIITLQLIELVTFMKKNKKTSLQVRLINTLEDDFGFIDQIDAILKGKDLTFETANQLLEFLKDHLNSSKTGGPKSAEVLKLLEKSHIQLHHQSMLFNSRYFKLNQVFKIKDLTQLLEYETKQRLSLFKDIVNAYRPEYESKDFYEFKLERYDHLDWFDLVSSAVTKSFHSDDTLFLSDVSRFDFSSLNLDNSIDVTKDYSSEREVDVLVILNPIEESSQKFVSIVNSLADLPFINIQILLQPTKDKEVKINRYYRGVFPSSEPNFDSDGNLDISNKFKFSWLPLLANLTTEFESPKSWLLVENLTTDEVDLQHLHFDDTDHDIETKHTLKNILVEGFARDVKNGRPPAGLSIDLDNGDTTSNCQVMANLGYLQFKGNPGIWNLRITPETRSEKHYQLLSANLNKYDTNDDPLESVEVPIFSLNSHVINARCRKNAEYSSVSLLEDESEVTPKKTGLGGIFGKLTSQGPARADINIFSIPQGHLSEHFFGSMVASVRAHTAKLVKIWILEDFLSGPFKNDLPKLAEHFNVEVELIGFRWPTWLRTQTIKQRISWGYKVLFLDVLFPQDVEKVIFVDTDQIVRTDLLELVDEDLGGAPYGFPPIGDSRRETEGFRFWKSGYWSKVLKEDLQYHGSSIFVVDLKRLRAMGAGDTLRSHYQKLSSDVNSLSNLDLDLVNNLQEKIPIHSLGGEWLWCEAWNSDEELESAKVLSLCPNPLRKEGLIERAKRQVEEWRAYDEEVQGLRAAEPDIVEHDEL